MRAVVFVIEVIVVVVMIYTYLFVIRECVVKLSMTDSTAGILEGFVFKDASSWNKPGVLCWLVVWVSNLRKIFMQYAEPALLFTCRKSSKSGAEHTMKMFS